MCFRDETLYKIPPARILLDAPVRVPGLKDSRNSYLRTSYWKCRVCAATFDTKSAYSDHAEKVHQGKVWPCHLCEYAGWNSFLLVSHLWRNHNIKCNQGPDFERFRCKFPGCSFKERDIWTVTKHIKRIHLQMPPPGAAEGPLKVKVGQKERESTILQCDVCQMRFGKVRVLAKHLQSEHDMGIEHPVVALAASDEQNKKSKGSYKEAAQTGANSIEYQCSHCGWPTTKRELMNRHMAANHPEDTSYDPYDLQPGEYHCKICNKVIAGAANWHVHRYSHLANASPRWSKEQCDICGKSFSKRNIAKHKAHAHGTANQTCPMCKPNPRVGPQLYTLAGVNEHIRASHRDSGRVCPVADCLKVYRQDCEVIDHYRYRHMNYLTVRCKICNKRYDDMDTCKYHIMWVHEKVKKKSDLDPLFFDKTDLIEDYKVTDPNYPTKDIVQAEVDKVRLELMNESSLM